jgi:(4-(4-[2-(gamma-L-glutamylamino)ethyl]phenoxymethyl)furan-2-yl)methanamine synthase
MKDKLYLGWDIGGANTKVCVFDKNYKIINQHTKNIKVWSNFSEIRVFLKYISSFYSNFDVYNFITITAESCDNFKNRNLGMTEILSNCSNYIKGKTLFFANNGKYVNYDTAIKSTEKLFSTNWILTSKFLNYKKNIDLIIDVGSTTTDIIFKDMNIENNINDHMRLTNKTLLYLGVVRTPLPMIADNIKYKGRDISLVNEVFATTGDIFNINNDIDFSDLDYLGSDNLQFTKENSFTRLARVIGLDYKDCQEKHLIDVANNFKNIFISKIIDNIREIFSDNIDDFTISSIGEGRFIIKEMCKIYNINYTSIDNINYNSIVNVDKNKVYSNMTSALVVLNFIKNKNHV